MQDAELFIELTADIVSAYVSRNTISVADLPKLVTSVHASLRGLSQPDEPDQPKQTPAVPVSKSVTDEYIVCLEDGKRFKSLKRHLTAKYGMTPDEYRRKWNLPADYPMVAPSYSRTRSKLAKRSGLGQG